MNGGIFLTESPETPCPYLPGKTWKTRYFTAEVFPGDLYEELLGQGFRRSGGVFYRNHCPGCDECRQIRIPVTDFIPSKSQRRVCRRNEDLDLRLEPVGFSAEILSLFRRYQKSRHSKAEKADGDFRRLFCRSPLDTRMSLYLDGDRILGVGWLDFLPRGLSSVYFVFDPEAAHRSLGIFSVLREIELARSLGLSWYYLGFVVQGSPKMAYKGAFLPLERLVRGEWTLSVRPPADSGPGGGGPGFQ